MDWIAAGAILLVLIVGYIWLMRGFFSALLHLACTIAAGAIAFAVWEPAAYWLLDIAPQRGFFLFLRDASWGLALGIPFAVSLVLLRVAMDKLIRANVNCDPRIEYIGGGVCGLFTGILTVGIVVLSINTLRFGQEWLGNKAVWYSTKPMGMGKGSMVTYKPAFRPYVDELTAGFYQMVSRGSLRPEFGRPLGDLYPELAQTPSLLRFTYEGRARNTIKAKDFQLLTDKSYTVGDSQGGGDLEPLMHDAWNPGGKQIAIDMDEKPVGKGYLLGLVIKFMSGAKETGGGSQVVIGPAQLYVVAGRGRNNGEDLKTVFPVAVISQTASDNPAMGRWRYDAERIFIASVGGASDAVMGFEFPIPTGYKAKFLYVKNIRVELAGDPELNFSSWPLRDGYIKSGRMDPDLKIGESADQQIDSTEAEIIKFLTPNQQPRPGYVTYDDGGIKLTPNIGFIIKKGTERSLKLEDSASGKKQLISSGEETFSTKEIKENSRALDKQLQIKNLAKPDDVVIVRINVSAGTKMSMLGRAALGADQNRPPALVDANGQTYEAVGYIYKDPAVHVLRFTPGSPMNAVAEARPLSKSQSADTSLEFIFRCSRGVSLVRYQIGNKVIADWTETPIKLER